MRTSSSNIRRLRSGVMGSISAWLPSRRSTAHQRGATVVTFSGQVRSGRPTGVKGAYRWIGISEGCWGWRTCGCCGLLHTEGSYGAGWTQLRWDGQQALGTRETRGEGADLGEGLAAAHKQEAAAHGPTVSAGP